MANESRVSLNRLSTEQLNPRSADLDMKSSLAIARTIDLIAGALQEGGRLIYVGAGTSGRIAALDAVECPPTFNTPPKMVQFVMAGGAKALVAAVEADEDSRKLGQHEIAK